MIIESEEDEEIEQEDNDQYRDRAAERRKDVQQEVIDIKLGGLDEKLLQQNTNTNTNTNEKNTQSSKDIISKIKNDIFKLKSQKPKQTTNPMAIKLESYLVKVQQPFCATKSDHIYVYDLDPHFGHSMPTFISKSKKVQIDKVEVKIPEDLVSLLRESLEATNYCCVPRQKERYTFEQKLLLDDEDIFADIHQPKQKIPTFQNVEKQSSTIDQGFDPKEYLNDGDILSKEYYEQLKEQVQMEEEQKKAKLLKHKQMLDGSDYYLECFQPLGLTIDEEKEHKEEVENLKLLNPNYKDMDFIKQDKIQRKKKKRQNLNLQLDKIEDIITKKPKK